MNILITGAYGFVGTNLSNTLKEKKYTLWALDISYKDTTSYSKSFSWNDLEKLPWNEIDIIIHLAGKAHDLKNKSGSKEYFDVNTVLTQKIYDWFLKSQAKKFIFFSSVKAVADIVENDILTEDVVPKPVGPYGESKIAAENYILHNLNPEKIVYILRPCMIHGPGNKGNLNLLYNLVHKGIPYPLGLYENKRSFTSIDNLSFIVASLVERDIPFGIYNISDDEALSTNELVEIIAGSSNKPKRIWKIPKIVVRFFSSLGTLFHLPFNNDRLQKLTENYIVSNEKIKNVIGIKKMPLSSKDGFKETIKSLKNE